MVSWNKIKDRIYDLRDLRSMSNIKKKFLDISSIGIADALASGIAALFWFYIASLIGPESYGEITYLLSIAAIAAGISTFGSNYTLMVYSVKKIEIQKTIYLIGLVTGLFSSIVVFLLFMNLGVSLVILGFVMLTLVTGDLLGRKLYKNYSKFVILQKILMIVFSVGLYYVLGENGILIGIGLSYFPLTIEVVKGLKKSKINFKLIKEKKNFILNNFSFSLTGTVYSSLDKLMIAPLFGYMILGNYVLGYQFFFLLYLLPLVVQKYVIPQDSSNVPNKKLKKLMVLSSFGLAIIGSTVGPAVMSFLFPKFLEVEDIIRIISWAIIPVTINAVIYHPKFWANEQNHKITLSSAAMVATQVLGIVVLGFPYGMTGLAAAFVIGHIVGLVVSVFLDRYTMFRKNPNL